jgi:hypothetical protein
MCVCVKTERKLLSDIGTLFSALLFQLVLQLVIMFMKRIPWKTLSFSRFHIIEKC